MKFKVTTEFGAGVAFQSADDEDRKGIAKMLEMAASGELKYLGFNSDIDTYVIIPAKVLETSILELIE